MSPSLIKATSQPDSLNPAAHDTSLFSPSRPAHIEQGNSPAPGEEASRNSPSSNVPPLDPRRQSHPLPASSEQPPAARRQSLTMFFSDLYKSPKATLSKFRHTQPPETCDYGDPDLLSKDKIKQKAAVRKFLAEKIRNDWEFTWPPAQAALGSAAADAAVPSPEPDTVIETTPKSAAQGSETTMPATTSRPTTADGTDNTPHSHPSENATGLADQAPPTATTHTGSQATPPASSEGLKRDPPLDIADSDTTSQALVPSKCDVELDDGNASDDDTSSIYSVFSEDEAHFRPRLEWTSELSDDESDDNDQSATFKFESPETVGETIRAKVLSKKEKRRRAVKEEATWNVGLACYEARRNAWTGARTVRLRKKPVSPTSGFSPRRLFFRSPPATPLSSSPTERKSGDSGTVLSDISDPHKDATAPLAISKKQTKSSTISAPSTPLPVETIIPVAPPLLPPSNPMRASISPAVYPALYDKLVLNGLTPSCPVNLSDMIRACVCGWKRDGEWPPKATMAPPPIAIRKKKKRERASESGTTARRMSFGLLGRDKEGGENASGGSGIRRSVQRILGIHHHHPGAA
ncbi:hypothetical protein jhhlp_001562 [Lomentospora prolificans]|uniref:Gag1-like clamp domain-containing protein n=1 Tax=Lomentospora prolificans TaxID=41688 RepID=A0A2N3NIT3_9PEZI|nr:hypothetical protein jhhlp_001562 [Lomentospora prolificans]